MLVKEVKSCWWVVTSGAAQGSVLVPVLFNSFVNDLDQGIDRTLGEFADKTKRGKSVNLLEGKKVLDKLD